MFEKDKPEYGGCRTASERQALDNLNALLQENEPRDLIDIIDLDSLLYQGDTPPINITNTTPKSSLKKPSSLYPALSTNHGIATFLKMIGLEIKSLDSRSSSSGNLTKDEKMALRNLSNNHDITIKPSDKGGNVVLMEWLHH